MANTLSNTVGLLLNNANPQPDGVVETPVPVTLAATGTTQATAAAIVGEITTITNNTAANGVILPVPTAGQKFFIIPALATNAPLLYPPVGGSINFGTVNAGLAITARKGALAIALDATGNYLVIQGS